MQCYVPSLVPPRVSTTQIREVEKCISKDIEIRFARTRCSLFPKCANYTILSHTLFPLLHTQTHANARKRTHNQPPTVSLSISDKKCYPLYLNIQRGFLTPTPHFPTQMPQPPPIFHQRSLHFGKHCMIIRRSGGIDGLHSLERIWWDYKVVMVVYRGG